MLPERDAKLEALAERLREVERRLSALERVTTGAAVPADASPDRITPDGHEQLPPKEPRADILPLVGQTILVLAGAFLLRAMTEMGILPAGAGTATGFAYAMLWLFMADRSAGRGRRTRAMFHGVGSAIIAFPLIWEATVKFEYLSPRSAAAALLATSALALVVVWRRRLRRLAWVITVGAGAAALVLAVATRSPALYAWFLVVLGFATLWLGWLRGWQGPGWLVAAFADFVVLLMTVMLLVGRDEEVLEVLHPESAVGVHLALLLIYCGSLGARTLASGRELRFGEVVQGAAAVVIGLGGALALTLQFDAYRGRLGFVSLALAVGCYAASFAFIDRRGAGRTNFVFFTTAALLFTLAGFGVLLAAPWRTLALATAAAGAAWLGASRGRATLSLHAASYALVAAITSGLLAGGVDALLGSTVPQPREVTLAWIAGLAALTACAVLPVATNGRTWGRFSRSPKAAVLAVMTAGVAGLAVVMLAPWLPQPASEAAEASPSPILDPASLAVARTGVLALATLLLAWLARTERLAAARWLVYPLLAAGGAKLLLEDLRAGRATTLFLSLALYGGALIVAPRILRESPESGGEPRGV